MSRAVAAGAALLLLGGCIPLGRGHVLDHRAVAAKHPEWVLVADDGATCRVDSRTYGRVHVGHSHTCAWKEEMDSTQPGGGIARHPWLPEPGRFPRRPE